MLLGISSEAEGGAPPLCSLSTHQTYVWLKENFEDAASNAALELAEAEYDGSTIYDMIADRTSPAARVLVQDDSVTPAALKTALVIGADYMRTFPSTFPRQHLRPQSQTARRSMSVGVGCQPAALLEGSVAGGVHRGVECNADGAIRGTRSPIQLVVGDRRVRVWSRPADPDMYGGRGGADG